MLTDKHAWPSDECSDFGVGLGTERVGAITVCAWSSRAHRTVPSSADPHHDRPEDVKSALTGHRAVASRVVPDQPTIACHHMRTRALTKRSDGQRQTLAIRMR